MARLSESEITKLLDALDGWRLSEDGKGIEKHFGFADFNAAFGFIPSQTAPPPSPGQPTSRVHFRNWFPSIH